MGNSCSVHRPMSSLGRVAKNLFKTELGGILGFGFLGGFCILNLICFVIYP